MTELEKRPPLSAAIWGLITRWAHAAGVDWQDAQKIATETMDFMGDERPSVEANAKLFTHVEQKILDYREGRR